LISDIIVVPCELEITVFSDLRSINLDGRLEASAGTLMLPLSLI